MTALNPLLPAKEAKEIAIKQVSEKNKQWMAEATEIVRKQMPILFQFNGEELRGFLMNKDLDPPTHHNAWGALVLNLIRAGLIVETGEYRASKATRSHARRSAVYARV